MSGFFFCGMRLEPVEISSASLTKPNSELAHSTMSSARRLRWIEVATHAYTRSSAKSRSDTASMLFSVSRGSWSSRERRVLSSGRVEPPRAPEPSGIFSAAS